ncbi:MAG: SpoIIE family protein phosphatase [Candidatus Baltobacteraceae bacterium]
MLVQAARSFTVVPGVADSLAQIAGACVVDLAEYCSIEIVSDSLERDEFSVSAGTLPRRPIGARGTIVEPLRVGPRALGAMTYKTSLRGGFDEGTRRAISLLAMQLAIVIDGRLGMLREHRIADRLQQALLPDRLPRFTGGELHAAFLPASDEAGAGGDWFDAFALDDGRIAISLGDVGGHGLEAALVMGEVRQALRRAAADALSPAQALERVNAELTLREPIGMVTALFGIYDPVASTLAYSAAGHPPPLLALADGFVLRLPTGGLPLGCAAAVESGEWSFTLPAGSHAICYTDGMTENDRDLAGGEERLSECIRAALCERARRGGGDLAADVQERVFDGVANRDDAAMVVLSRHDPVASYAFSAVPVAAPIARAIVQREIEPLALDSERRFGILVAVGEAVANAVEHAYRGGVPGLIRLEIRNHARQLVVIVEDFGQWRRVARRGEHRGRGIDLMHAFMGGVKIRRTGESTRIVLKTELAS